MEASEGKWAVCKRAECNHRAVNLMMMPIEPFSNALERSRIDWADCWTKNTYEFKWRRMHPGRSNVFKMKDYSGVWLWTNIFCLKFVPEFFDTFLWFSPSIFFDVRQMHVAVVTVWSEKSRLTFETDQTIVWDHRMRPSVETKELSSKFKTVSLLE